jgi:hypothetical protein
MLTPLTKPFNATSIGIGIANLLGKLERLLWPRSRSLYQLFFNYQRNGADLYVGRTSACRILFEQLPVFQFDAVRQTSRGLHQMMIK